MDDLARVTVAALFVTAFVISFCFRWRADRAGGVVSSSDEPKWIRIGLRGSALLLMLSFVLFVIVPQVLSWCRVGLPHAVRWSGAGLSALAILLQVWMFVHLGRQVTPTVIVRKDAQLVTTGPYRFIRHPLYTFGCMFVLGLCLLSDNWLLLFFIAIALPLLLMRTPIEERKLRRRFGKDWDDYAARTGRYLPRIP